MMLFLFLKVTFLDLVTMPFDFGDGIDFVAVCTLILALTFEVDTISKVGSFKILRKTLVCGAVGFSSVLISSTLSPDIVLDLNFATYSIQRGHKSFHQS